MIIFHALFLKLATFEVVVFNNLIMPFDVEVPLVLGHKEIFCKVTQDSYRF
jgi:hypothetical protein